MAVVPMIRGGGFLLMLRKISERARTVTAGEVVARCEAVGLDVDRNVWRYVSSPVRPVVELAAGLPPHVEAEDVIALR
jgi:hypothetical protein